jgi:hypothetical protein
MRSALFWDSTKHKTIETTIVRYVKSQKRADLNKLVVLHGLLIHLIQQHAIIICAHVSQPFIKTTHTHRGIMWHTVSAIFRQQLQTVLIFLMPDSCESFPIYATKAQKGTSGTATFSLNLRARWR